MALGEFEQLVLLAALHMGRDSYGVELARAIEDRTGRSVSRSALYVTYDRLELKGYITSQLRTGTRARGGKMRRYIKVTRTGLRALRESRAVLMGMWSGLESKLGQEA